MGMMSGSDSELFGSVTNPFLILINSPIRINNKSGTLKNPHEHFKRGCTNFKRSQTIMNEGGLRSLGCIIENPKELGILLTSEVLVDFHMVLERILYTTTEYDFK